MYNQQAHVFVCVSWWNDLTKYNYIVIKHIFYVSFVVSTKIWNSPWHFENDSAQIAGTQNKVRRHYLRKGMLILKNNSWIIW